MSEFKNPVAKLKVAEIEAMTPSVMVEDDKVSDKFISLFNDMHGSKNGKIFYNKEKFNFLKIVNSNPVLKACTPFSLFGVWLDIAVSGLSLDSIGGRPHCYITSCNEKIGKDSKGADIWGKIAQLKVTGYGELVLRMRAGQVKYADNPVIVYEGDYWEHSYVDGKKTVSYRGVSPRLSNVIIGAFIRIQRNDGSVDFAWLEKGDIDRLKGYSEKQNRGTANALYTSLHGGIDSGFLEAKMIKHAFDVYPKVRTGNFTALETQEQPQAIDYGVEEESDEPTAIEERSFDEAQVITETETPVVKPNDEIF